MPEDAKFWSISNLKSVKEKEDATAEEIKKALDELMQKFHQISQKMYQQAQPEGGFDGAQDFSQESSSNNDDIVDADFTEVDDK